MIAAVAWRRTVYPVAAGLLFGLWVLLTLLLAFVGQMMNVDEEWQGWGDIVLNPYFIAPWVLVGIAFIIFSLLHLRWRR
jgi:hypothetical protein